MSIFEELAITEEAVGALPPPLKSLFLSMRNDIKMLDREVGLILVNSMVHDTDQSTLDDIHNHFNTTYKQVNDTDQSKIDDTRPQ
jgi:hypothetical protein